MSFQSPIGVFDSGLGGLTVLKEMVKHLPDHDFIYLGDNARAPYGPRDFDTVYQYTLQAVQWLFDQGCPLVILACNTASAKALRTIQQKNLPLMDPSKRVLGVIRPTTEVIGDYTETNHIGILGTKGTVESCSYVIESEHLTPKAEEHVKSCLDALLGQCEGIDTILLGCTHYPLLLPVIRQLVNPAIQIISQGEIVAESLVFYLKRHPEMAGRLSKGKTLRFFTTGDVEQFGHAAGIFWGEALSAGKAAL
ncbi:MAG: glutamate racemase [Chitinophagaceae bacterium]|nr:glutamate racemase [Chitinophagaceae bacterium]